MGQEIAEKSSGLSAAAGVANVTIMKMASFPKVFYEGKMGEFINQLISDLPRRLCMDKRKRLSLRSNVRNDNSYYTNSTTCDLEAFAS
jgi:hypothetical protein